MNKQLFPLKLKYAEFYILLYFSINLILITNYSCIVQMHEKIAL